MALFSRLLKLHKSNVPSEDFFTEIFAYLLSDNHEILYGWLKHIHLLDENNYLNAHISTQQAFDPLDHHLTGSRPDISIELIDDNNHDIIFIESKVGAQSGYKQLSRYADILDDLSGFRHKVLVYITRDFDPKNEKIDVFGNIPSSRIQFRQFRWYQFHQFLRSQVNTKLVQETIIFMEEHNMANNNQFSSVDVLALTNFSNSLKLMEATMWGKVEQKFVKVLGGVKKRSTALTGVKWHGRYLMTTSMPGGWWCGLGFLLRTSNPADYPKVCLVLEVLPNSPSRTEIIKELQALSSQAGWKGYGLNEPKTWSGVIQEKNLRDFLAQEDHVVAIEEFFLSVLDELSEIKNQYSQLPWGAIQDDEVSPEDDPTGAPFLEQ